MAGAHEQIVNHIKEGRQFVISTKATPFELSKIQSALALRNLDHYFVLARAKVAPDVEQFHYFIHMVFPTNTAKGYVN